MPDYSHEFEKAEKEYIKKGVLDRVSKLYLEPFNICLNCDYRFYIEVSVHKKRRWALFKEDQEKVKLLELYFEMFIFNFIKEKLVEKLGQDVKPRDELQLVTKSIDEVLEDFNLGAGMDRKEFHMSWTNEDGCRDRNFIYTPFINSKSDTLPKIVNEIKNSLRFKSGEDRFFSASSAKIGMDVVERLEKGPRSGGYRGWTTEVVISVERLSNPLQGSLTMCGNDGLTGALTVAGESGSLSVAR